MNVSGGVNIADSGGVVAGDVQGMDLDRKPSDPGPGQG